MSSELLLSAADMLLMNPRVSVLATGVMQLPAEPLVLSGELLLSSPLLLLFSANCWPEEQLERLPMLLLMLRSCEDPAGFRPLP